MFCATFTALRFTSPRPMRGRQERRLVRFSRRCWNVGVALAILELSVPALCRAQTRLNVKEAVDCYFDETMDAPKVIRLHFVRDEVLTR